jgi:hypothetical protein
MSRLEPKPEHARWLGNQVPLLLLLGRSRPQIGEEAWNEDMRRRLGASSVVFVSVQCFIAYNL